MEAVGLIGFGVMGAAAGARLIEAGHPLLVYDAVAAALEKARARGAAASPSAADVARKCPVVLLFLPGPEQVAACVSGPGGLLRAAAPGAVIVDHSTIDPETTIAMAALAAEKRVGYLDAPILGRPGAVGHWALPVGGDPQALERCRPVLETFAGRILPVGPSGTGHKIKLLNQMMFGAINAMTAEMMAIADHMGVSPRLLYDTITASRAGTVSNLFVELGRTIVEGNDQQAAFSIDLLCKDIRLAVEMARAGGAPPLLGSCVQTINDLARAQGFGSRDTAAMWRIFKPIWDPDVGGE